MRSDIQTSKQTYAIRHQQKKLVNFQLILLTRTEYGIRGTLKIKWILSHLRILTLDTVPIKYFSCHGHKGEYFNSSIRSLVPFHFS